jgi:ribonuclease HII
MDRRLSLVVVLCMYSTTKPLSNRRRYRHGWASQQQSQQQPLFSRYSQPPRWIVSALSVQRQRPIRPQRYRPLPRKDDALAVEQDLSAEYTRQQVQIAQRSPSNSRTHHAPPTAAAAAAVTAVAVPLPTQPTPTRRRRRRRRRFVVMGTDESGTGCLAGPIYVVSCAIIASRPSEYIPLPGVADSKVVSMEDCHAILRHVQEHPTIYAWTVAVITAAQLDASSGNWMPAILDAQADSIVRLVEQVVDDDDDTTTVVYSIVDGHRAPTLLRNHSSTAMASCVVASCRPWKHADATVYTVALASCMARSLHATYMATTAHVQYPAYRFDEHGGYATRAHIQALDTFGPSPIHRRSSRPVRQRCVSGDPSGGGSATGSAADIASIESAGDVQQSLVQLPIQPASLAVERTEKPTTRLWERTTGRALFLQTAWTTVTALSALSLVQPPARAMYLDTRRGISLPEVSELELLAIPTDWSLVEPPMEPLTRLDDQADAVFYTTPRFGEHVDAATVSQLTRYVTAVTSQTTHILDLCASWTSHLTVAPSEATSRVPVVVAGLGMNAAELAANPSLTEWIVQDLNVNPHLPYPTNTFDVVLCQLSIDYLTYPLAVCRQVARVLKPNGTFHVVFSNRLFVTKAVSAWTAVDDLDRATLVASYLHYCGPDTFSNLSARDLSVRNRQGSIIGDPLYVVTGTKRG